MGLDGRPSVIVTTLTALMYAQKLGSGMFAGLGLTASFIVSIWLDHMGGIGFKQHPASIPRILGGLLMISGRVAGVQVLITTRKRLL